MVNNMNSILQTPQQVMLDFASRIKDIRIEQNLTQKALAEKVGIAVGTINRFEKCGEIQWNHLLRIALVLGCLEEFDNLCRPSNKPVSLFNLPEKKIRQRARSK